MKRLFRSATTLVVLLSLLVSCNGQSDSPKDKSNTTQSSATSTTVTTAPTTTLPPKTEEAPQTKPPTQEEVVYPAWEGNDDIALLATLDAKLLEIRNVSQYGDRILISGAYLETIEEEGESDQFAYVQVLDVKSGELSQLIPLTDANSVVTFLDNGNVCVYNQLDCYAEVYTPEGQKQYTFVSENRSTGFYLDPSNGGTLWTYSWDDPKVTRVPLSGGQLQMIRMPLEGGGYIMGSHNGLLCYSAWNNGNTCIFTIDENGTVGYLEQAASYNWGGNCFYTDSLPNCIMTPAEPGFFYQIDAERIFQYVATADGTKLLTYLYGDTEGDPEGDTEGEFPSNAVYQVLDYGAKTVYPGLATDGNHYYTNFLFSGEQTVYFIAMKIDENCDVIQTELCRWEYAHDPQPIAVEKVAYESLEPSIQEIVRRIEEKWGVKVFYQPELIHLVATDYNAEAVTDLQTIYTNILQLEQALAGYPVGFFEDICYDGYTHLELYLCGTFTPVNDAGIQTAQALATTRGNALVIGFNTYLMDQEYTRVLAHEMMHIMERRIDGISFDILTEWMSLTPGGYDAYYFSYHDEDGNEMCNWENTYYTVSNRKYAYFIDAYSKSFPTEDRARVFEALMASGGKPYFNDAPVLMEKARFLCRVIRENFPSVAALERAAWELAS